MAMTDKQLSETIAMMYTYAAGLDPTKQSEERTEFAKEAADKVKEIKQRFMRN